MTMKKNSKINASKTLPPDEQPRKSSAAEPPPPWTHGKHQPISGRVFVTPEMASEWLEANRVNRRVRSRAVDRITRDIKRGRWIYNGQSIVFSKTWRLLDGQHRLMAIVAAGVAVEAAVATGVEDAAMDRIDTNGAGGRGHATAYCAARGIEENNDVNARINACYAALTGEIPCSSEEFGEAYEAFMPGVEAMATYFAAHRAGLGRASIAAAFIIAWRESPDAVIAAAQSYITGANLPAKHPMLVLRDSALSATRDKRTGGGTRARIAETRGALSLVLAAVAGRKRAQAKGAAPLSAIERLRELHEL